MNTKRQMTILSASLLMFTAILVLAGCQHYEATVEVRPDGSGTRTLTVTLDDQNVDLAGADKADIASDKATLDQFLEHYALSPENGWKKQATSGDGTGDEQLSWTRESMIDGPADWAAVSGDVLIMGAPGSGIRLTNSIELEVGQSSARTSFTYRESFAWTGLREYLVGWLAEEYAAAISSAYPFLTPEDHAELRGLYRGIAFQSWELLADMSADDAQTDRIIDVLTSQTEVVIRARRPRADCAGLRELVSEDPDFEEMLMRDYVGIPLAGSTDLVLKVGLPGEIVETNGKLVDGGVEWSLDLNEVFKQAVEFRARSEVIR